MLWNLHFLQQNNSGFPSKMNLVFIVILCLIEVLIIIKIHNPVLSAKLSHGTFYQDEHSHYRSIKITGPAPVGKQLATVEFSFPNQKILSLNQTNNNTWRTDLSDGSFVLTELVAQKVKLPGQVDEVVIDQLFISWNTRMFNGSINEVCFHYGYNNTKWYVCFLIQNVVYKLCNILP